MSDLHEEGFEIPRDGAPTQLCFALSFVAPSGTCMHDDVENLRAASSFSSDSGHGGS